MSALAVSTLVNSAKVDDRRCCQPREAAPEVPGKLDIRRKGSVKPDGQQTLGL